MAYGAFLLVWLAVQIATIGFGSALQYVFLVWGLVFLSLPFERHLRDYLRER